MSDTYVFGIPIIAIIVGALAHVPELSAAGVGAIVWTIVIAVEGRFIFQNQLKDASGG